MKQFFSIGLVLVTSLWALSATATDTATDTQSSTTPCCDEQARQVALKALPDPTRFKDDICWVAPEWQDN
jgi:hypothetical protein